MAREKNTGWFGRAIASATVGFVWGHAVMPWVVLVAPPIVTGWLAYLSDAGAYKTALAIQISFAAMSAGLYFADLELFRRRIKDKLQFSSVRFGRNIGGPGFFLGIVFSNTSDFPIEFEIKELRTKIGDRVPVRTTFDVKNVVVGPKGIGWFDDHIIQVDNPPKGGTIEGFIDASIIYGSPGNLKHELTLKKNANISFDTNGLLIGGSWHEAKSE